ncbi:GDSL-type esterase/lipase family protein [Paraclostridium sordellii]|uniref:GDSL-type esterase/lipase family protein n=1 Tax=Paraclostridium sordellii TaxID=1505 RepID=UPI0018C1DF7E|nr:GDSL-type esterase/lipase family protein [Paeniclostridium sordellii]
MRKIVYIRVVKVTLIGMAIILGFNLAINIYIEHFAQSYISDKDGMKKIKELESVNISSIKDKMNEDNNNEVKNKKDDNKKEEVKDFNKVFEDSVIMGDSRGEGLTEYEILSPSSVVAYKGRNTIMAKDDISSVVDLAPSKIFMTYGMNDLELFSNSQEFIKNYESLIKSVKAKLPNSKIYVTSIIPANNSAINKRPKFKNVYSFNDGIKGMCKNLNVEFIDVGDSMNSDKNLYEPDGIHFKPEFYKGYLTILQEKANL